MKYAHVDNDNKLLGWYSDDLHKEIPEPKIAVTDDVWQEAISKGHNKINSDGTTEHFDFRTLDDMATDKIKGQISSYQYFLSSTDYKMTTDYEPKEGEDLALVKSKRKEARDYIRDNKQYLA